MKHLFARTLTFLMLVVMGLAVTAPAQSMTEKRIKANIPFEFNFGDKTFPAGEYILAQPLQHLLVLRDSQGRGIAQELTVGIESPIQPAKTQLRFNSSGGQYTLREVWRGENSSGERLYPVKAKTATVRSIEARETAQGNRP
jgi:hypothetical protein